MLIEYLDFVQSDYPNLLTVLRWRENFYEDAFSCGWIS